MSAFSFDGCHEWFAKAQKIFANCFIRQIVQESAAPFQIRYVLRFRFQLLVLLQHASPHVVAEEVHVWTVWRHESLSVKSGLCLPSHYFVQLWNSFLTAGFRQFGVHQVNTAWSNKICAKLRSKQMKNIWCKNIHTFMRYYIATFVLGHFILFHPVDML